MKQIDLNNCWCEATEENFEYISRDNNIKFNGCKHDYLECDNFIIREYALIGVFKEYKKKGLKQIHLVKGNFEYVEQESKQCQFAKYGFEVPDFECEILGKSYGRFVGWACGEHRAFASVLWDNKGIAQPNIYSHYNLTPLKKPWYEDKSNYGKIIVRENNNNIIKTIGIFIKYEDGLVYGVDMYGEFYCDYNNARPATKKEILNLLVKE